MLPLAFLLAITGPFQVRLATCPKWEVARVDTVWSYLDSVVVAHPIAAAISGGNVIALAGRDRGRTAEARNTIGGIILDGNGRRLHDLTKPPGDFTFDTPKMVVDSHGRAHAVWAETVIDSSSGRHGVRLEVWHSRLDDLVWTPPDRVLSSVMLRWTDESLGNVAIGEDDRIHVVLAAAIVPAMGGEIVHFASSDSGWIADTLHTVAISTDPVISLSGHRADIAYISPRSRRAPWDENGAWVTSLDLDRRVFDDPVLVRLTGKDPASLPQFLRRSDGALDLFWVESEPGEFFFKQIGGAVKAPGVDHWTRLPGLISLPHLGISMRAVAEDRCGALHAMVTLFADASTTKLVVLTLRNSEWLPFREIPFATPFLGRANLIAASDGAPLILLSTNPWTRAWKSTKAPLYWQLFTMR